jgi:hypothetical protein
LTEVNYFFFFLATFFLATFLAFFFAAMFNSSIVCSGLNDVVAPQNVINMNYLHFETQVCRGFAKVRKKRKCEKPAFHKG